MKSRYVCAPVLAVMLATTSAGGAAMAGEARTSGAQSGHNDAAGAATLSGNVVGNVFGKFAFSRQMMSQNNIAAGANIAQQGAVAVAMLEAESAGGGAVSTNELRQVTVNTAVMSPTSMGALAGVGAMTNTFGDYAFSGQTMSQNNIATGVNVSQQGAVSVTMQSNGQGAGGGIGAVMSGLME